jgi:hypothetical protein
MSIGRPSVFIVTAQEQGIGSCQQGVENGRGEAEWEHGSEAASAPREKRAEIRDQRKDPTQAKLGWGTRLLLTVLPAGGHPLAPPVVGVNGAGDDGDGENDEEKLHGRDQGSGIRDQGSGIRDQGSGIRKSILDLRLRDVGTRWADCDGSRVGKSWYLGRNCRC